MAWFFYSGYLGQDEDEEEDNEMENNEEVDLNTE